VVIGCWDILVMGAQPLMFGLNAADGRILWQRDLAVLATVAAADGMVFASDNANGELLAVDALTGKLLWKRTASEQYPSAPQRRRRRCLRRLPELGAGILAADRPGVVELSH
jgi:outer membrane protein assembly factor BamB